MGGQSLGDRAGASGGGGGGVGGGGGSHHGIGCDASSCVSRLLSVSVGVPAWCGSSVRGCGSREGQGERSGDGVGVGDGWRGLEAEETVDMWVREVLAIFLYAFKGYL